MELSEWLNSTDYIGILSKYIALPSRSHLSEEVIIAGKHIMGLMQEAGLEPQMVETSGNPVILAKRGDDPDRPTILLYGHYDVQPEGDLSLWNTPPFEPHYDGTKFYGRGSADNKGQHLGHILALKYLFDHKRNVLDQVNIRFILDGDEERGSFTLPEVFKKYKNYLSADLIIVSDGPSLVSDRPTIVGGVRGILTFQITITSNQEDLHSGNFGGLAQSATNKLIHLLGDMVDEQGRAKIEGFYNQVYTPSELEVQLLEELKPIYDAIVKQRGIDRHEIYDQKSNGFLNQLWPTFNINGLAAGGVGKDRRTIIPSQAIASIDCRLIPHMESERIKKLVTDYVNKWAVEHNCRIEIESEHAMEPVTSSLNDPHLKLVRKAYQRGFGVDPVLVPRLGGSLPLQSFTKYLDKHVFLIPYALPDENNHAPNENLDIPYFLKGIHGTYELIKLLSEQ